MGSSLLAFDLPTVFGLKLLSRSKGRSKKTRPKVLRWHWMLQDDKVSIEVMDADGAFFLLFSKCLGYFEATEH